MFKSLIKLFKSVKDFFVELVIKIYAFLKKDQGPSVPIDVFEPKKEEDKV